MSYTTAAPTLDNNWSYLISEDVLAAIKAIKELGIKVHLNRKECKIYGKGLDGYQFKKKLTITFI